MLIKAPPERIWHEIHNVRDIRRDEVDRAWIYRIGVPLPQAGVTETTPQGRVRKITMGKDIRFDQVVADWDENRHVRWTYRFAEDSFPALRAGRARHGRRPLFRLSRYLRIR